MQRTKVRRWTMGRHDRLYISTIPAGAEPSIEIGWFDLRTQHQQLLIPGMVAEFDAAITWWRHLPEGQQATAIADTGGDLAATPAGSHPGQRADQLRPGLVGRMLARLAGQSTPDQSWRIGAAGEQAVARKLDTLTRRGWRVLHSIDTGAGDIDHLLIGPPGVFVINTKHHPGGRLDVKADAVTVNGRVRPYVAQASTEATLARSALHRALGRPVYVGPIVVIHGHDGLTGWRKHKPRGVRVLPSSALRRWAMLPGPAILNATDIGQIFDAARAPSTWQPASPAFAAPRSTRAPTGPQPVFAVSSIAPQWSTAAIGAEGRSWVPLREFPAGPADPRTSQWREHILAGDLGDLLSAKQVAAELGLLFEELRQLVIDSEFYWYRKRQGRPALPPPDAPDHVGEPEWFRYSLAEHFGAPYTPRDRIRNIYAEFDEAP